MTDKQFQSLKIGDLIRNKYNVYYISDIKNNCYIIKSADNNNWGIASEPRSWTKVKQNKIIILGGQYEKCI